MSDLIQQLEVVNTRIGRLEDNVSKIRERLFNGHTELIKGIKDDIHAMKEQEEKRKRNRWLIVKDIFLLLIGSGGGIVIIRAVLGGGG
jgi:t-SNARE complex subunit (syntaxin)